MELKDLQIFHKGWNKLIENWYNSMDAPEEVCYYIQHIKEKYGRIDLSTTKSLPEFDELENASSLICSECGITGRLRPDLFWRDTLCDKHYEERKKKVTKRFD